jgi:hypothetical protein
VPTDPGSEKNPSTGVPVASAESITKLDAHIPYLTDVVRHKDEISHKRRNTYAINALFSDSHVALFNDEAVFNDRIWTDYENGTVKDDFEMGYKVFRLIRR